MAYGIRLHCWGDFALFTRPEMKVERVSYDVITPSAARGVVEAFYWKPEIRWVVDRLHVLRPVRFTSQRRNEVGAKIPANAAAKAMRDGRGNLGLYVEEERQQRAALLLRDVAYLIEAHFEIVGGEAERGQAPRLVQPPGAGRPVLHPPLLRHPRVRRGLRPDRDRRRHAVQPTAAGGARP
jgi:CRISPR-associated protein Cas5d